MRKKVKLVTITVGSTKQQVEDSINAQLTKGWVYVGILPFESKTWLVFEKTLAE